MWMVHGLIGLTLVIFGIRQARDHSGRSLEMYLAAVGVQLAGVVVLVSAL